MYTFVDEVFAWLLTDLFCWFVWFSRSGFGSLKLGTSEYTMQNLWRQNQSYKRTFRNGVGLHFHCVTVLRFRSCVS